MAGSERKAIRGEFKSIDSNVPILSLTRGICYLWQGVDPCREDGTMIGWGTRTHALGYWKTGREGILW